MTWSEFGWIAGATALGGVAAGLILAVAAWLCNHPSEVGRGCGRGITIVCGGAAWPARALWRRFLAAATASLRTQLGQTQADVEKAQEELASLRSLVGSLQERVGSPDPKEGTNVPPDTDDRGGHDGD